MVTPTLPQPTKFVCAVCDQTRPLQVEGKPAFTKTGDGRQICYGCTNAADTKAMDEGAGISLRLEWDPAKNQWLATNPTGKLQFPLIAQREGMTPAQILGAPAFTHKGRQWRGRFYAASGTAHFTPTKEPAPATARGRSNNNGAATVAKTAQNATPGQTPAQAAETATAPPTRHGTRPKKSTKAGNKATTAQKMQTA